MRLRVVVTLGGVLELAARARRRRVAVDGIVELGRGRIVLYPLEVDVDGRDRVGGRARIRERRDADGVVVIGQRLRHVPVHDERAATVVLDRAATAVDGARVRARQDGDERAVVGGLRLAV